MNKRRQFFHQLSAGTIILSNPLLWNYIKKNNFPVRPITRGPKYHWFGYYDKLQFSSDNRYVLGMQVDFEMRSPTKEDTVKVGFVDLENRDKWTEIGESRSWGWQQGCMLQWIPGSGSKVIWNDRRGTDFVSVIKDIHTGEEKVLPRAIYTLSPDGKTAIGTDFSRIQNYRKGYGYPGGRDLFKDHNAPSQSGIYKIDLEKGEEQLLFSYHEIANIPNQGEDLSGKWHYFNHLLMSPDGQRFIFLNRWRDAPIPDDILDNPKEYNKIRGKYSTRMFTADINGGDIYLLDPSGKTSHFIWKDPSHITAWTTPKGRKSGFYELRDKSGDVRPVGKGVMVRNGHNTFLPGTRKEWILNDTYPVGEKREQIPYIYNESSNIRIDLGRFHEPKEYNGEWRCDTHPRSSNEGSLICIDSTHGGNGRQMYLIDISGLGL